MYRVTWCPQQHYPTTSHLGPLLSLSFLFFSFLWWEHVGSNLLENFTCTISLPSWMQVSSSGFLFCCWKMDCSCLCFIPRPYHPGQERSSHSLPLTTGTRTPVTWATWNRCVALNHHSGQGQVAAVWWLSWTGGYPSILCPVTLSKMLSPEEVRLIRTQGYTRGWSQPTKNHKVAMRAWQVDWTQQKQAKSPM